MQLPETCTELVRRPDKTVYDLGDRIAKVFDEGKTAAEVFNEALNLARINECGIASPQIREVSQTEAGAWTLVTSKLTGVTLAQKMECSPARFYEYLERFVDLQIAINTCQCPPLAFQQERYSKKINGLAHLDDAQRFSLLERLDSMSGATCVCHGDFFPTNVIVQPTGAMGLCDWAHATQGAPEADAAITYLLFARRDTYQAEYYLEMYCDHSGRHAADIRRWIPIVAAVTLTRAHTPAERTFYQDLIDV